MNLFLTSVYVSSFQHYYFCFLFYPFCFTEIVHAGRLKGCGKKVEYIGCCFTRVHAMCTLSVHHQYSHKMHQTLVLSPVLQT